MFTIISLYRKFDFFFIAFYTFFFGFHKKKIEKLKIILIDKNVLNTTLNLKHDIIIRNTQITEELMSLSETPFKYG